MLAHDLPHARPRRLTRAEYHRLAEVGLFRDDERVELIHGTVVEMAPIGPPHANVVDILTELLVIKLAGRAKVRIQQPLLGWDESEPEPDVAVVPARSYAERHPDEAFLVIEVAESSLDYDRATKAPLYARSGVQEYWIVDVSGRAVIVHREASPEGYATVTRMAEGESVSPSRFPDLQVAIATLFA
jgi:Uma2 family endonuclease